MEFKRLATLIGTDLDLAVNYLQQGGVVAFPTETYYGLAVDPDCTSAVTKLYKMKKRGKEKPLLLLVENDEQINTVANQVPLIYWPLIRKYWPGPLTLIFPAKQTLNEQITGNTGTIGIRISPHPLAQQLVRRMGKPITATSANISGFPPARTAQQVVEMLGDNVDYVVDGGQTEAGLASTVLTIQNGKLTLLRRGKIDLTDEFDGNG